MEATARGWVHGRASGVYLQTMTGKQVEERLQKNDLIILLIGSTEAHGSHGEFGRGHVSGDASGGGIKVLALQTAEFQRAKAMSVMENLLQTYPQIDAVWAGNDEEALGAVEALDAAGRMTVTVDQQPPKQSGDAVQALIDYLNKKTVQERIVAPGFIVDSTTISQYAERIK